MSDVVLCAGILTAPPISIWIPRLQPICKAVVPMRLVDVVADFALQWRCASMDVGALRSNLALYSDSNAPWNPTHILVTVCVRCVRCAGRAARARSGKGALDHELELHRVCIACDLVQPPVQRVDFEIVSPEHENWPVRFLKLSSTTMSVRILFAFNLKNHPSTP